MFPLIIEGRFPFLLSAASLLAGAVNLSAQNAPLPPELENLQVLNVNKELPHNTLMPYGDEAQALAAKRLESPFARSLNGDWSFHYVPRPELRPVDFYRPEYDVSGWKTIPVPSCWQMQGYGVPEYTNITYPFKNDPPRVTSEPPKEYTAYEDRDPVGSYRRDFEVPPEWAGRRVFITFDGVDSNLFLWINGQRVGYSTNSRAPAEFDLTKYLHAGKNVLAAEVYRFCAGSYLEDQDMWRMSGIFRNVTLWSTPVVHVRDFSVQPDLDAQYRDGTLHVVAKVKNYGDQPAPARALHYQLYDRAGQTVPGGAASGNVPALAPGEENTVDLQVAVANPQKWSAEIPILYTSVVSLDEPGRAARNPFLPDGLPQDRDQGQRVLSQRRPRQTAGLQPARERGGNGSHRLGRRRCCATSSCSRAATPTTSAPAIIRTIPTGTNSATNTACTSWPRPTWSRTAPGGSRRKSLSFHPEWKPAHIQREVDNVESQKNHASVVIWSLGNESGWGPNFDAAYDTVKKLDPTRYVHYEGWAARRRAEEGRHGQPDVHRARARWTRP